MILFRLGFMVWVSFGWFLRSFMQNQRRLKSPSKNLLSSCLESDFLPLLWALSGDMLSIFNQVHLKFLYFLALFRLVGFSNAVNRRGQDWRLSKYFVVISLSAYSVDCLYKMDILLVILAMIGGLLGFFVLLTTSLPGLQSVEVWLLVGCWRISMALHRDGPFTDWDYLCLWDKLSYDAGYCFKLVIESVFSAMTPGMSFFLSLEVVKGNPWISGRLISSFTWASISLSWP